MPPFSARPTAPAASASTPPARSSASAVRAASSTRCTSRAGAKIRLPRSEPSALSAVLLNTAGGLTGEDEIRWHAAAGIGSRLSVATAASEKVYRTHGPPARQCTTLAVEADARLDWLPQETILFDGARLERTLRADLAADATLLAVEAIAFGRRASGEELRTVALRDRWRVYRDGELLHAESFRLDESPDSTLAGEEGDRGGGDPRSAARSRGRAARQRCDGDRSLLRARGRGGARRAERRVARDRGAHRPSDRLLEHRSRRSDGPGRPLRGTPPNARRGVSAMDGRIVLRSARPVELRASPNLATLPRAAAGGGAVAARLARLSRSLGSSRSHTAPNEIRTRCNRRDATDTEREGQAAGGDGRRGREKAPRPRRQAQPPRGDRPDYRLRWSRARATGARSAT